MLNGPRIMGFLITAFSSAHFIINKCPTHDHLHPSNAAYQIISPSITTSFSMVSNGGFTLLTPVCISPLGQAYELGQIISSTLIYCCEYMGPELKKLGCSYSCFLSVSSLLKAKHNGCYTKLHVCQFTTM